MDASVRVRPKSQLIIPSKRGTVRTEPVEVRRSAAPTGISSRDSSTKSGVPLGAALQLKAEVGAVMESYVRANKEQPGAPYA